MNKDKLKLILFMYARKKRIRQQSPMFVKIRIKIAVLLRLCCYEWFDDPHRDEKACYYSNSHEILDIASTIAGKLFRKKLLNVLHLIFLWFFSNNLMIVQWQNKTDDIKTEQKSS